MERGLDRRALRVAVDWTIAGMVVRVLSLLFDFPAGLRCLPPAGRAILMTPKQAEEIAMSIFMNDRTSEAGLPS